MIMYYNPQAIERLKRNVKISPRGFRHGFVKGIFHDKVYEDLVNTFPDVNTFELVDKQSGGGRKRFYTGPNYYSGKEWGSIRHFKNLPDIWYNVAKESGTKELIDLLQDAMGVRMNSLCNFGFTYGNENCVQEPHIDGAARPGDTNPIHATVACLMYFSKKSGGVGGTEVYDVDRKTVLFQVPDLQNSFFFFEEHPDAWHGFPRMPKGSDRRLVSLSYSHETPPIMLSESLFHPSYILAQTKKAAKKILY